ncbi:interleukin-1 receptor-associated kinase 4-like isoform X2 [Schistocerca gregaria]|uniref:interleukin-1 receptor-associated kinase 4-like isoform X2 n=1 Tax=Schistocerca gregaria TaxID=7010 RepID=UPI00211ECF1C|nr:interleukin-1 receptor-associated kinase 4-like isoform X2 [Schistocerca gregaria]
MISVLYYARMEATQALSPPRRLSSLRSLPAELEIRKLPPQALFRLVQILEYGEAWKQLMAIIPKTGSDPSEMKYKVEHVKLIEHHANMQKRPCAEIFLEEWSTSGRIRPNLAFLLELLVKAELYRAAEFVAGDLLKDKLPERPESGPAAAVDLSDEALQKLLQSKNHVKPPADVNGLIDSLPKPLEQLTLFDGAQESVTPGGSGNVHMNNTERGHVGVNESNETINEMPTRRVDSIDAPAISNERNEYRTDSPSDVHPNISTSVPNFPYSLLDDITNHFSETPVVAGQDLRSGRKLGTGAFGSVYLGILPTQKVAVKRLKRDAINVEKQFQNEIHTLSRFRHENLLPLVGYSCDGPNYCLVYEYMSNGSLQERLACQGSTPVLNWQTRLDIALGTSRGILYLHTAFEKPLVHRDIKSANILLNDSLQAKLGDFGLVHLGAGSQQTQSALLTSTVFGTSAYMAPEAFRGDVSVKLDAFSFGVVLLELLTSLSPYDENREGCDLVTHVDDICEGSIEPLLDTKAGSWTAENGQKICEELYVIAIKCLEEKRLRPSMDYIVNTLENIAEKCGFL